MIFPRLSVLQCLNLERGWQKASEYFAKAQERSPFLDICRTLNPENIINCMFWCHQLSRVDDKTKVHNDIGENVPSLTFILAPALQNSIYNLSLFGTLFWAVRKYHSIVQLYKRELPMENRWDEVHCMLKCAWRVTQSNPHMRNRNIRRCDARENFASPLLPTSICKNLGSCPMLER